MEPLTQRELDAATTAQTVLGRRLACVILKVLEYVGARIGESTERLERVWAKVRKTIEARTKRANRVITKKIDKLARWTGTRLDDVDERLAKIQIRVSNGQSEIAARIARGSEVIGSSAPDTVSVVSLPQLPGVATGKEPLAVASEGSSRPLAQLHQLPGRSVNETLAGKSEEPEPPVAPAAEPPNLTFPEFTAEPWPANIDVNATWNA